MYFDLKRQRESNLHLLCQREDPEATLTSILLSLITVLCHVLYAPVHNVLYVFNPNFQEKCLLF